MSAAAKRCRSSWGSVSGKGESAQTLVTHRGFGGIVSVAEPRTQGAVPLFRFPDPTSALALAAGGRAKRSDPAHQRRLGDQLRRPGARLPDFATLDLLSGGRAKIMAGLGSFIESFLLFGFDLEDYGELVGSTACVISDGSARRG